MKKRTSIIIFALLVVLLWSLPAFSQGNVHTVQSGETLSIIAARYGVTPQAIMSANGLHNPNLIYAGQRLVIPGGSASTGTGGSWGASYTVRSGDTLTSIAQKFGTTAQALVSANNLASDMIYVGQVLNVPGMQGGVQPPIYQCSAYHMVMAGDTLSNIAWRYGVTVDALKAANHLASDMIYVGQKLCIPGRPAVMPPIAKPPVKPPHPPIGHPIEPPYPGKPDYKPPAPTPPDYVGPDGAAAKDACFAPGDYQASGGDVIIREVSKWCASSTYQGQVDDGLTSFVVRTTGQEGQIVKIKRSDGGAVNVVTGVSPGYASDQVMYPNAPGNYEIWVDGGEDDGAPTSEVVTFKLEPGQRVWVDFSLTSASESPRPRSYNGWSGRVAKNTSGVVPATGVSSVIVVRGGARGLPMRIKAEGEFGSLCYTGAKLEHGEDACEFGGLWPGKYTVLLDGAEVSVEVYVDGVGMAEVVFDRK